jgi:hypothetical protein
MARHKDANWNLTGPKIGTWDEVKAALLMDVRDELKEVNQQLRNLNSIFNCSNFLSIPRVVAEISHNTKKTKRKAAKK